MIGPTARTIGDLITKYEADRPRSKQTSIGPSEMGTPCGRRLAYRALNLDPVPHPRDILPAQIGTWAHTGMQHVLAGNPAWSTEIDCRIPGFNIPAHVDAYHHPTGTIIDWKFVGDSSLRKHKTSMSVEYRTQVHLYGFALQITHELPVHEVAVCLIPRNGPLGGIHLWSEPYDEDVVEEALARWGHILALTSALGPAALPLIPTAPTNCVWCPWNNPTTDGTDLVDGCPGHNPKPSAAPAAWQPQQMEGTPA